MFGVLSCEMNPNRLKPSAEQGFCSMYWYEKEKWSRYSLGVAQKVGRGVGLLFHDRGTRREWVGSAALPGLTLPPGKTRYSFYRRLGGAQGRSGRAENLVPTGIRSRTVQPVAQSLYRLSYPAHECIDISWENFLAGLMCHFMILNCGFRNNSLTL